MAVLPRRSPACLSCALVALLFWASRAQADELERAASLQWIRLPGAEVCSDAVTLSRAVDEKLGRVAFKAPSDALLLVEGRVERTEGGYRAKLELRETTGAVLGSREILSAKSDCVELSEAVAVVLAVMVDPEGAIAPRPPAPAPPVDETVEKPAPMARNAARETRPPVAVKLPAPPPLLPEADVSGFARVALGQLPEAGLGVGVAFELGVPGWGGLRIEGAGFRDQTREAPTLRDAGVRLRFLYGGFSLCPLWMGADTMRLTMCGGVQGGVLQTRSHGATSVDRDTSEWMVQGEAALRYSWRLWRGLAVHLGAAMTVPLSRPLYEARLADGTRETVFEPAAVGAAFDAGLGGHF